MVGAVVLGFLLQLALIYIPFFQNIFSTQPLSLFEMLICLVASAVVLFVIEIFKWVVRNRKT
jgi:Ca2+-transporting ATPase